MQDFDRHIKDLLEDAEVEVPSGVWEAVSAGLDRADAKKKIIVPPVWWRQFYRFTIFQFTHCAGFPCRIRCGPDSREEYFTWREVPCNGSERVGL